MGTHFLNLFFGFQVLIVAAAVFSHLIRILSQKSILNLTAKLELRFNHLLMISVFVLPLFFSMTANQFKIEPIAKTYSAITLKDFDAKSESVTHEKLVTGKSIQSYSINLSAIQIFILLLISASICFSIFQIFREFRSFQFILSACYVTRRYGRIRVAYSNQVVVPFSIRALSQLWIVLPESFSMNVNNSRIAMLHEMQHHRQGDTLWQYLFFLLKASSAFNPMVKKWLSVISEVQELKVDEVLIDQKKIKPQEYARCLIEVAESVVMGGGGLVCATGLAFLPDRHQLKRRIETMFTRKVTNKINGLMMGLCLVFSMSALALTTSRVVGSSRLTMVAAQKMAEVAQENSEFPIVVNDLVLEQLNRYIGTTQGRAYMRESLRRMKTHQPMIERKLQEYDLPLEFLAMPIIESGYQNLLPNQNTGWPTWKAAGLWQFIKPTARGYGLQVDATVDERLDLEKSTDAAMRLLKANQIRFKKWDLSVIAYNSGEKIVSQGILNTKSYDAWNLIQNGYEGDSGYLAKLMAAILIMRNPSSVE
ncbi:MAG: transglycosylase SLT domain-containing protein [Bdellovibrionales bacterium]|nr:transglycosylase SLT domain-containing protein [Bdellovibrionales bacterium]